MGFIVGLILGVILMCCLVARGNFNYKIKWDKLRKWLYVMKKKCFDTVCLDAVLTEMYLLEGDEDE